MPRNAPRAVRSRRGSGSGSWAAPPRSQPGAILGRARMLAEWIARRVRLTLTPCRSFLASRCLAQDLNHLAPTISVREPERRKTPPTGPRRERPRPLVPPAVSSSSTASRDPADTRTVKAHLEPLVVADRGDLLPEPTGHLRGRIGGRFLGKSQLRAESGPVEVCWPRAEPGVR